MKDWFTTEFWHAFLSRASEWSITTIPSLLLIIILAFLGLKIISIVFSRLYSIMIRRRKDDGLTDTHETEKRVSTLIAILKSSSIIMLWIMVIMLLLRKIGIDIAPLIAGAGIAGLAIGFGAQELVRDVISGFFILFENQIRKGDVAIVNGTSGLVEEVGLRTIILRDMSGVVHVFQNGKINTIANMTKEWSAIIFDIGVSYREDTDRVVDMMNAVSEELCKDPGFKDRILEPIEIFGVDAFNENSVVIKARLKTVPIEQWDVGREYRRRLKKAFDAAGVEMPITHRAFFFGPEIPTPPAALPVRKAEIKKS